MGSVNFIDIHTHQPNQREGFTAIYNIPPSDCAASVLPHISTGLHPWFIDGRYEENLSIVSGCINKYRLRALGEIGLDKRIDVDFYLQIIVFEQQLEMAEQHALPVIIHCVGAYDELLRIRKTHRKTPWILHGFNSSLQMANQFIDKDCFLSFGEMLYRNSKAVTIFHDIPVEKFFLETDDSAFDIADLYALAAHRRKVSIDILKKQISSNFAKLFGLDA